MNTLGLASRKAIMLVIKSSREHHDWQNLGHSKMTCCLVLRVELPQGHEGGLLGKNSALYSPIGV